MSQPKAPPLSVRLSDDRLELIDAFAQERSISRHSAVVALIDLGLAGSVPSVETAPLIVPVLKGAAAPKGPPPKLAIPSAARERMTMDDVRPAFVSRLKQPAAPKKR